MCCVLPNQDRWAEAGSFSLSLIAATRSKPTASIYTAGTTSAISLWSIISPAGFAIDSHHMCASIPAETSSGSSTAYLSRLFTRKEFLGLTTTSSPAGRERGSYCALSSRRWKRLPYEFLGCLISGLSKGLINAQSSPGDAGIPPTGAYSNRFNLSDLNPPLHARFPGYRQAHLQSPTGQNPQALIELEAPCG